MMQFRSFTRFVIGLMLGLVLTLSSYPVYSQDFPSFEDCANEVKSYPSEQDLNQYNDRQVYCLFVVELLDGGVQPEKEYFNAELFGVIMNALRDTGDALKDKLTYKQIIQAFPGDQLNRLINESIAQAEMEFSLFQSPAFPVASLRITPDSSPSSSELARYSGRTRGGKAVDRTAKAASRRRRR